MRVNSVEENGLIGALGQWLYWHGPSEDTVSQFFVTVLATGIVVTTVTILEPYVRIWNRRRNRKVRKELRRQKDIVRRIKGIPWRAKSEEERLERNQFLRELTPKLAKRALVAIVIAVVATFFLRYVAQYSTDSVEYSKGMVRLYIEQFDTLAKSLRRQTTGSRAVASACDYITGPEGRREAEIRCRSMLAYDRTETNSAQMSQKYQQCMLSSGWLTEKCNCRETDDKCITISTNDDNCPVMRWKTNSIYIGSECSGHIPAGIRRIYAETECSVKAQLYGEEKWYEGFSEFDRLLGTILAYRTCMAENGWITADCESDIEDG